jgi:hypothetical protein
VTRSDLSPITILSRVVLWPTVVAVIFASIYTLRMLSVHHSGKDSWLEEGLYMLAFHGACLIILLPWFIVMICSNWARMRGWRWRLLAGVLTLAVMAAAVCIPEMILRHARH